MTGNQPVIVFVTKGNRLSSALRTLLIAALACWGTVLSSQAQIITLIDNNSLAQINVGSNVGSQIGMFNWSIDNANQLNQHWFWYRIGTNGPESSIDTISPPVISVLDSRRLYTRYNNGAYGVEVDYVLTGGSPGSGASSMAQSVTITNTTTSALQFHFFAYADFDIGINDMVELGQNLRGLFNESRQTGSGVATIETVVAPGANHCEGASFNSTLTKLNNANPDTLNDTAGPIGPGDVTSALEWDLTIPPGSSTVIVIRNTRHL